jgi:hypothetical protein
VFALEPGAWLDPEPRVRRGDGMVLGPRAGSPPYDARVEPLLSIASTDEEPAHGSVLDDERTWLGDIPARRTFSIHEGDPPLAAEQWRFTAGGQRWTVTALTALADQPLWGPALAAAAATISGGDPGPHTVAPFLRHPAPGEGAAGAYEAIALVTQLRLGPDHAHPVRHHIVERGGLRLHIDDGDGELRIDGEPATTTAAIRALIALLA